jgi:hypothetical protein
LTLPASEDFVLELVSDAPWPAYQRYTGDFRSLIEVNTSLPMRISSALYLATHEGYPGHHVDTVLSDIELVRDRGWIEYAVWPLFSPETLVAEGLAEYAMELVFPLEDRARFAEQELFPLAGIEGEDAKLYFQIEDLAGVFSAVAVARRCDRFPVCRKIGRGREGCSKTPESRSRESAGYQAGADLVGVLGE